VKINPKSIIKKAVSQNVEDDMLMTIANHPFYVPSGAG
jgi:hypothetical protein